MSGAVQTDTAGRAMIPDFLRALRSVLLAVIDRDGELLDANRGFRALLPSGVDAASADDVRAIFLNPSFNELAACAEKGNTDVYAGLMTLGAIDAESDSWLGHVWFRDGCLLVVCERDVYQDRYVRQQLLELTEEYAQKERESTRVHRQLAEYAEAVEHLSLTDSLTALSNRRHFDTIIRYELESSSRDDTPVALLLIDLDRFKVVNDACGHMYDDVLLKAVAVSLTRQARAADLVACWGGEEFVVLAPGCDSSDAMELAQRLRRAIQETRPDDGPGVTATIGVAEHWSGESGEDFLRRVDKALLEGTVSQGQLSVRDGRAVKGSPRTVARERRPTPRGAANVPNRPFGAFRLTVSFLSHRLPLHRVTMDQKLSLNQPALSVQLVLTGTA